MTWGLVLRVWGFMDLGFRAGGGQGDGIIF